MEATASVTSNYNNSSSGSSPDGTPNIPYNPNMPLANPPGDTGEYRVTVKQKKKQTAACDACKKRRRKCSGALPCAYCSEKGCECNYSQQHKRGKRKMSERPDSSPQGPSDSDIAHITTLSAATLGKAQRLYGEAERQDTVEKFCGMRWWWKNLLDQQAIKQSPLPAHRVQNYIINAWMSRLNRDPSGARHYYDLARNVALNGSMENDNLTAATTAYLLLADYAPSEPEYYQYSWNMAKNMKPGSALERHVYTFASSYQALLLDNVTPGEKRNHLLSFGSHALQSAVVDLWDTANLMIVKTYAMVMCKFPDYGTLRFLRSVHNLTLQKEDRDNLLMDVRACEVLMQSQSHLFGFEFFTCSHFIKILLLWAGGDKDKAVSEAIRYVQNLEQYGDKAMFIVEIKNMVFPLMILNEVGITQYNHSAVGIIETICKDTDQPKMLAELIPLFNELRISASPPAGGHPLSQAAAPLPTQPFEVTLNSGETMGYPPTQAPTSPSVPFDFMTTPNSHSHSPTHSPASPPANLSGSSNLSGSDSYKSSSSGSSPNSPHSPPPLNEPMGFMPSRPTDVAFPPTFFASYPPSNGVYQSVTGTNSYGNNSGNGNSHPYGSPANNTNTYGSNSNSYGANSYSGNSNTENTNTYAPSSNTNTYASNANNTNTYASNANTTNNYANNASNTNNTNNYASNTSNTNNTNTYTSNASNTNNYANNTNTYTNNTNTYASNTNNASNSNTYASNSNTYASNANNTNNTNTYANNTTYTNNANSNTNTYATNTNNTNTNTFTSNVNRSTGLIIAMTDSTPEDGKESLGANLFASTITNALRNAGPPSSTLFSHTPTSSAIASTATSTAPPAFSSTPSTFSSAPSTFTPVAPMRSLLAAHFQPPTEPFPHHSYTYTSPPTQVTATSYPVSFDPAPPLAVYELRWDNVEPVPASAPSSSTPYSDFLQE